MSVPNQTALQRSSSKVKDVGIYGGIMDESYFVRVNYMVA
jgi:hypothetical protein